MGWAEALAAMSGAMRGGLEAHQWGREQEQQDAQMQLRQRAAVLAERRAAAAEGRAVEDQGRERATWRQQDADRALENLGEGSTVSDPRTMAILEMGGRGERLDVGQTDFGNLMGGMMTGTVQPSAATVTARRTKELERQAEQDAKDAEFGEVEAAFNADPRLTPFLPMLKAKRGGVTLQPDELRTPEELGARKLGEAKPQIDYQAGVTRQTQAMDDARNLANSTTLQKSGHELATALAISRAILGEGNSERAAQRKAAAAKDDGTDPFGTDSEEEDADYGGPPAPSWFGGMAPSPTGFDPVPARGVMPAAGPGGAAPMAPAPARPAAPAPGAPAPAQPTAPNTRTPQAPKMSPQEQNLRGQMDRQMRMVKEAQAAGQDTSGLMLRLRALRDQMATVGQGRR